MLRTVFLTIVLWIISQLSWSSELYTGQAVMHNDSDEIMASVKFNTPETGDMYVATIVNGKLLFLNQDNSWTETIIPFRVNETFQGEYSLFTAKAGILPPGNYPLYQLITKPNAMLFKENGSLNVSDWVGGADGLNFLSFSIGVSNKVRVLAFNDLGMHCNWFNTFSIFTLLPPFNVVNAQVVGQNSDGKPQLLDSDTVELSYSAVTDRKGSINSSSKNKTDFWKYTKDLFGMDLQPGEGLTGSYMPADNPENPGPQPFQYNDKHDWFSAIGIPITHLDDQGQANAYPLLRINAHDKETGELLGATDVVLPISAETNCHACHATGKIAAKATDVEWIIDDDSDVSQTNNSAELQSQKNILLLHDKLHGTHLQNSTPVLCASCHYTTPLDLAAVGPQGVQEFFPTTSQAIHKSHGEQVDTDDNPIFPNSGDNAIEKNCYQCHPGKTVKCQRGAMKAAGIRCMACHGGLLAIGGKYPLLEGGSVDGTNDGKIRRPWFDMPRCQSCHTGDAIDHLTGEGLEPSADGIRLKQGYKTGDKSASALLAKNKRFAENDNTLYRNSKGHSGIACEGCHGSPHATWPIKNPDANDNLTAIQLQGHSGTIIECDTCHTAGSLELTMEGPHGLHNINDSRWTNQHKYFYMNNANTCKACHGKQLEGTPLAKMAVTRSFNIKDKNVVLEKGQQVSCNLCHDKP